MELAPEKSGELGDTWFSGATLAPELRLCGRSTQRLETAGVGLSWGRQLWYSPLLPVSRDGKERLPSPFEQEDAK